MLDASEARAGGATGIPLVALACRLMLGEPLAALGLAERAEPTRAWAKEAIFPEDRFPGADARGPEMRSTGEVMAGGATVAETYARPQSRRPLPRPGPVGPPLQALGSLFVKVSNSSD